MAANGRKPGAGNVTRDAEETVTEKRTFPLSDCNATPA